MLYPKYFQAQARRLSAALRLNQRPSSLPAETHTRLPSAQAAMSSSTPEQASRPARPGPTVRLLLSQPVCSHDPTRACIRRVHRPPAALHRHYPEPQPPQPPLLPPPTRHTMLPYPARRNMAQLTSWSTMTRKLVRAGQSQRGIEAKLAPALVAQHVTCAGYAVLPVPRVSLHLLPSYLHLLITLASCNPHAGTTTGPPATPCWRSSPPSWRLRCRWEASEPPAGAACRCASIRCAAMHGRSACTVVMGTAQIHAGLDVCALREGRGAEVAVRR